MNKKICFSVCALLITFTLTAQTSQNNGNTSIAMLNYLATETRLVVNSANNRLVLEETYNKIINNTNPAAIDQDTRIFLETFLNSIEQFRMLGVQRERLEYIFENQKSQAINQALPNPLYLLGARDINPLSIIATFAVMTVDSIFKFQGAVNNAEMSFLRDNWELDDDEAETLHGLRREAFFYMRDITVNNNLRMADTLNENSIDNFVRYSLDENLDRRQQWLESNCSLYANYAPFWLVLADTYYDLELYRECIDSVVQYEAVQAQIFRQERDYVRILPKVIIAVSHVHGTNQTYVNLTRSYLEKLITHTTDSDWALRYFAAQAYIRLAGITNRNANLTNAYNLLVNNVTYLSRVQENLLAVYMAPVDETIPRGIPREKERQMRNVIDGLKRQRRIELPPMHEGLLLNYLTLVEVMNELNTPDHERNRIKSIIDRSIVYKMMRQSMLNEKYDFMPAIGFGPVVSNRALAIYNIPVVFLFPEIKTDIMITENNDGIETLLFQQKNITFHRGTVLRTNHRNLRVNTENIDSFLIDISFNYDVRNNFVFRKEKDYFIYVTFYFNSFEYTLRLNKEAGVGSFIGSFDITKRGEIIHD